MNTQTPENDASFVSPPPVRLRGITEDTLCAVWRRLAIERGETISEMEGERKRLLMAIEEWIKACPDCGGKGVIPSDQPWSDSSEWLGCPACGSLRAVVKP